MRINVYAEELTLDTELITKVVNNERIKRQVFYGVRMYLKSPDELHHTDDDDDRSAITFWVPWTKYSGHAPQDLIELFDNLRDKLVQEFYQPIDIEQIEG